jgi:GT2 family glycosyltransferase
MPATQTSHPPSSILVVAVVYKCKFSQSQTVCSLFQILNENPELAKHFSLVLYDNSPQSQTLAMPALFPTHYVHDPANGGLATAYNFALARAESEGRAWLLLLDQDTSLTRDYLFELLEAANNLHASPSVAAIVPKLLVNGIVYSPVIPFLQQLRLQFLRSRKPLGQNVVGVSQQPVCCYNSGSTFRISALRAIGGFPAEFWLDFLDHAVFNALFAAGHHIYVMHATLVHESSYADLGSMPVWRLHNVLMAQTLYVKKSGNFLDQLLFRIYLLRHSRNVRQACKDPRMWREIALQAFLLRVPEQPRLPLPVDRPTAAKEK